MSSICLEFKNLTLGYQGHAAVHHLSGEVQRGALTAIVGANGSGKSTLMKGIAGVKRRTRIHLYRHVPLQREHDEERHSGKPTPQTYRSNGSRAT